MQDSQVQEIQKSVGETLGELRRQKNLSAQEVATQLRLDVRIIEALEADNYDNLPSPAYIRGYLRNYAKLLGADSERIIALYNHKAPQAPEIIPDVKHPTQVSSSDKPVKAVTYLISFILVLLLFAWLQSHIVIKEATVTANAVSVEAEDENPSGLETFSEPLTETEPEISPGTQDPEIQHELPEPVTVGSILGEIVTDEPVTEGEPTPVTGTDQEATAADEAVDSMALKVDETRPPTADGTEGPDSVSMKLTADSWIEIYDAFDNKLMVTLGRSGEEISLKGTAPFHVKLGFSQGVTLYFNGDYFDSAPFSHGGVATFTLEP